MASSIKNNPKVMNLLNKGRSKGHVTYQEILNAIPQVEDDLEVLDELYGVLLEDKIEVLEDNVDLEEEASKGVLDLQKELKETSLQSTLDRAITGDPDRMYLREIGREGLLTAAEEVELAQMVEAVAYQDAILELTKKGVKKPNYKQIAELMLQGEFDDVGKKLRVDQGKKQLENFIASKRTFKMKKARYRLINSNLRLVVSIAKRYMNRGLTFSDLIQEGNIGLMRAVDKFDWRRGFKFSTYATWWIRQAITRAIADQSRTIRIPVHMVDQINRFYKTQRKLMQQHGKDPDVKDIAKEMEITVEDAENLMRISQQPKSLSTPVGDDKEATLEQFIADGSKPSLYDAVSQELLKDALQEVLETLSPREKRVLIMRFGLEDGKPKTLEEVGKEFKVTRERIRQIEAKAIRKLKHPTRARKLRDFLD